MKYFTARQAWHDSFFAGFSPDYIERMLNLSGGTAHDADSKIWHEVLAGNIQHAVSHLPEHLQAWGHLCFSPDNVRNPRTFPSITQTILFKRVHACVVEQFQNTELSKELADDPVLTISAMAIEHVMHLEQNGNQKFYSENDVRRRLDVSRHYWRKGGFQHAWHIFVELLKDWTGWALEPVSRAISEFEQRHFLSEVPPLAPVR